jgi:hypothetical protein
VGPPDLSCVVRTIRHRNPITDLLLKKQMSYREEYQIQQWASTLFVNINVKFHRKPLKESAANE